MPETRDLNEGMLGKMSDADRLKDCLYTAKHRAQHYAQAALESTNNGMREFFLAMMNEEMHVHEVLFSFLHVRGYYPTEMPPQERVREVRERFMAAHESLGLTDPPLSRRYRTADPKVPPAHLESDLNYGYKFSN
jgi:spore coat protein CotF